MEEDWESMMEKDDIKVVKVDPYDGEQFQVKKEQQVVQSAPKQKKIETKTVEEQPLEQKNDPFEQIKINDLRKTLVQDNKLSNQKEFVALGNYISKLIDNGTGTQQSQVAQQLIQSLDQILTQKEYQNIFDKLKTMISEKKLEEKGKVAKKKNPFREQVQVTQQQIIAPYQEVKGNNDDDFDFM